MYHNVARKGERDGFEKHGDWVISSEFAEIGKTFND